MAQQSWNLLQKFGSETLHHPPYSPDLAPSDFHVSRLRQAFFQDTVLPTVKTTNVLPSLMQQGPTFCVSGMDKLVIHCTKYFNCQGDYGEKQWTTYILILCCPLPVLNKILPVIYGYCKLSLWSTFIKFKSGLGIILQLTKLVMGLTTIRIYHLLQI